MRIIASIIFSLFTISAHSSVLVTKILQNETNDKVILMFLDNGVVETCKSKGGDLNGCRQFKIETSKYDKLVAHIEQLKQKNLQGSNLSQQVKLAYKSRFEQIITVNKPEGKAVSLSYYDDGDLIWGISINNQDELKRLYPRMGHWQALIDALNIVDRAYKKS